MSSRKLCSRSRLVDSRTGSVQGNLDENNLANFSQGGVIMTGEIRDPEVITSNPNLENKNDENSIINPNSDEQPNNISQDQLQDFFNTVMQAIKESAKQNAALQEKSIKEFAKQNAALQEESLKEFAKQTAALQEESKKQTALLKVVC